MILALFMLFSWPWSKHVEHFTMTVEKGGSATYFFQKKFKEIPTCTLKSKHNVPHHVTAKEGIVLHGAHFGDVVEVICQ